MTATYPDTDSPVTASIARLRRSAPLIGRVLIAAIFLISGFGKVADPASTKAFIAAVGLPLPAISYLLAVFVEIVGGALLVIGYRTRLAAVVLAIFAIVTAATFHRNLADADQMVHFLKNLAVAGGLLQVAAFGAGAYSVDRLYHR
jgi:putative oxidoreductase